MRHPFNEKEHVLVIVDNEKLAEAAGAKSLTPTFDKLGQFAADELPSKYTRQDVDAVYNPDFQDKYSELYKQAEEKGIDVWDTEDSVKLEEFLTENRVDPNDFSLRTELYRDMGSNEDFLGNGLTKNIVDIIV